MTRALSLAALMSLLPAAAVAQAATPTEIEAKAEQAETAARMAEIGPEIGAVAPAIIALDTAGNPVEFAGLAGEKGTIVAFTRSAAWCPFCQKQMIELEDIQADLAAKGWALTALTYDDPAILAAFAEKQGISYPLLSDTDSASIRAFNLLNAEMEEGTKYYGIPHPAVVFIGADGTVRGMLREEGYKVRPTNDSVLAMADAL